jgi:rRNA maturation RNase YbeY
VLSRVEDLALCPIPLASVQEDAQSLMTAAKLLDCELSLVLCSDAFIAPLNGQWRDKPVATDVLSFPQDDPVILGDLVISVDTAARQAQERGHDLRDEMRILLVHGLLHLLGYDHETSQEDLLEMAEAEGRLMAKLSWQGSGLIERVTDSGT